MLSLIRLRLYLKNYGNPSPSYQHVLDEHISCSGNKLYNKDNTYTYQNIVIVYGYEINISQSRYDNIGIQSVFLKLKGDLLQNTLNCFQ